MCVESSSESGSPAPPMYDIDLGAFELVDSEDMRKFIKVNCITAKGKVISARLTASSSSPMSPMHTSTASSTPRSSMSGASSRNSSGYGEKVPLSHVYKVVRFYSFWRTCTSFHRIVTMIDKVNSDDKHGNPSFKKRLFVQYDKFNWSSAMNVIGCLHLLEDRDGHPGIDFTCCAITQHLWSGSR
uniref:4a-hydroxytetrahydrobiopterin dehydratase n=1 Tax=Parascaris equorum TaxID=6256 RepID=A0A914R9B6_PAREQ